MIKNIFAFLDSGIKYLTLLSKTSSVRRMRKAIDYAERYIFLAEENDKEINVVKRKQNKKRLLVLRKAFFKYNQ